MEHEDAVRKMSVEKYLLGELTGAERDAFEDHLFDCPLCTADLKSGVTFAQAAREELAAGAPARVQPKNNSRKWFDWLLRPQWMAPALAACLLLIGYQNGVLLPALHHEAVEARTPHIASTLAMSSGAVRGEVLPHVPAAKMGVFVLQIDLPPKSAQYTGYAFSLYAPSGARVWQQTLPNSQAGDAVSISVPTAVTASGKNALVVQGVRAEAAAGARLDDLTRHEFLLDIQ